MVEKGFDHDALCAMSEADFVFLLESRGELAQARAAAEKEAARK